MKKIRESAVIKSILGTIFPLLFFSLAVCLIGYHSFSRGMLQLYESGAIQIAETAALDIDADRLDEYAESGGVTGEYLSVLERMSAVCNSSGATFIYVIRPDLSDYAHITFLFSTINEKSSYTRYDFGYVRETTNDDYKRKYRALYEGTSTSEVVIRDKGYIETDAHITGMIPLKGSDGETKGILCVQRQMEDMTTVRNAFVHRVILVLIVLAALVIILQNLYLRRVVLTPLKLITDEASRFTADEVLSEHKLKDSVKNTDEIGLLASSIDRMEEQIVNYVENLKITTAEKERISTELSLATRIQADMLPNIFPAFPGRSEFDIFASMDPAKEVGGDFYDFFLIDEDHLYMTMADVSGKGVPAALFMMVSQITLMNNAKMGKTPAQILSDANDSICANNKEEMFVTVWIAILEISTGKGIAANAGHEHPIIKRAGGEFELVKYRHSPALATMEGVNFTEHEFVLNPGDTLFVYTDGVVEATSESNELYGTERLLDALNKKREKPLSELLPALRADIDGFVGNAMQFDDITMLGLTYRDQ